MAPDKPTAAAPELLLTLVRAGVARAGTGLTVDVVRRTTPVSPAPIAELPSSQVIVLPAPVDRTDVAHLTQLDELVATAARVAARLTNPRHPDVAS